jgi:uncharacterized protein with HEPN domain
MRDPKEQIRDIPEAIAAIERYLDRGRAAFEQDELLQGWFVRHLQIIGEAARALPKEVRAMVPDRDVPALKFPAERLLKRLEELEYGC